MSYELYDILTIDKVDYVISSLVVENNNTYFLLIEIDEDENINPNNIKIMKRPLNTELEPDILEEILEEKELKKVTKLLENAMVDDLKEVE